jgi:hypothetical protein
METMHANQPQVRVRGKIDSAESKWTQLRQATRAHVLVAGASP